MSDHPHAREIEFELHEFLRAFDKLPPKPTAMELDDATSRAVTHYDRALRLHGGSTGAMFHDFEHVWKEYDRQKEQE